MEAVIDRGIVRSVIDVIERSDAERLADAAAGDPEAARWLVDHVGPVVYGFLHVRVGGDPAVAEDLLAETLIEVLRAAPGFRGDAEVTTWACAIARRRLLRHWERERRRTSLRERLEAVRPTPSALTADRYADRDEVVRALGTLNAVHRQVLSMKYLDGASVAEIATVLGRSPVQVQSLLQRARDAFRRAMGGNDD